MPKVYWKVPAGREDLHAVVVAIGNVELAAGVDRHAGGRRELAIAAAWGTETGLERAADVEPFDEGVARVGNEDTHAVEGDPLRRLELAVSGTLRTKCCLKAADRLNTCTR